MVGRAILGMMLGWITQLALAVTVPIPDALQPWKDWALFGEETARCPFHYQDFANKQCQWPGQLQLSVETGGLRFEQDWRLYTESTLALPGSEGFWPGAVTVNGKPATVGNGVMAGIATDSRDTVDRMYRKALELGGADEGAPGLRGEGGEGFYAAYFRDLDGNKLDVYHYG